MNKFFLLIACLMLVGCATSSYTYGNDFNSTMVSEIVKGETTTEQLQQMFGHPFTKSVISENEEKWIYTYTSGTAKAQSLVLTMKTENEGMQKMLDILIRDGKVVNYTYNEGQLPSTMNTH